MSASTHLSLPSMLIGCLKCGEYRNQSVLMFAPCEVNHCCALKVKAVGWYFWLLLSKHAQTLASVDVKPHCMHRQHIPYADLRTGLEETYCHLRQVTSLLPASGVNRSPTICVPSWLSISPVLVSQIFRTQKVVQPYNRKKVS